MAVVYAEQNRQVQDSQVRHELCEDVRVSQINCSNFLLYNDCLSCTSRRHATKAIAFKPPGHCLGAL